MMPDDLIQVMLSVIESKAQTGLQPAVVPGNMGMPKSEAHTWSLLQGWTIS